MKQHGMIFQGWGVKAILEGSKTMTRRVIKPQPSDETMKAFEKFGNFMKTCPYSIGDIIWVRETWCKIANQDGCLHDEPDDPQSCPCEGCHVEYKADTGSKYPGEWPDDSGDDPDCPKWKSPLFMPRWASRIDLEIIGVRAERLQEITIEDVFKEGIRDLSPNETGYYQEPMPEDYLKKFEKVWDSINAKKYPWSSNPWVWCISFKRI